MKRLVITLCLLAAAACGGSKAKPALEPANDTLPADDAGTAAVEADAGAPVATAELGPDGGPLEPLPAPPAGPATPVEPKGDEEGAVAFLKQFVPANADSAALTKSLRPTSADYKTMFDAATAAKVEAAQAKDWAKAVIRPKPAQTEVKVWSATGAELATGKGNAKEFPEQYKKFGKHLVPTVTYWRFKFVEPGKDAGTAYDGLVFTNGHWVLAPKPWRALEKGAATAADDDEKPTKKKPKKKK